MSTYSKTALSWFGLKDAMLYFPYVIPFCEEMHLGVKLTGEDNLQLREAVNEQLLPPDMRDKSSVEHIDQIGLGVRSFLQAFLAEMQKKGYPLSR